MFARLLPALLVLSLWLSGVVPQGMMRVAGGDGTRLMLCTEDGPRDIWMGVDGTLREQGPLPERNHEVGKCLAVTLALMGAQSDATGLHRPAEFSAFVPGHSAARPVLEAAWRPAQPRGPPIL
ncbi:hypothetical protein [Defluviimonas sp. SAOS-178_SWC]|uniref:hypothetical protein n=1 Tax=Defluviimonas sp. SAOS-178_SWC TaxID=3121287 RepID=UPI00322195C9